MAHIQLPEGLPGIVGLPAFSPDTARPLPQLAETLLRGPNTLTRAEPESEAAYVSSQNDGYFCRHAHGASTASCLVSTAKLVGA